MISTIENLFKDAFGLNVETMKVNEPYLVEEANVGIKSLNDNNEIVFSRILRAVKKSKRTMYRITLEDNNEIRVAKDHLLAILDNGDMEWLTAEEIYKEKKSNDIFLIGEISPIAILSIKKDGKDNPLDIEVENTHNYFSNGVLSHNSLYGADFKAAFSGKSVDYYSSWTARLTRVEDIKNKEGDLEGIVIKIRNTKSKVGIAKREAKVKLYFDKGIDSDDEYLDYLKTLGLIEQRGAWFYNEEWGMKVAGKNGVADFLHERPELYEKVKKQVNDLICGHTVLDNEEDKTEEEVWSEYTDENFNPETGELIE